MLIVLFWRLAVWDVVFVVFCFVVILFVGVCGFAFNVQYEKNTTTETELRPYIYIYIYMKFIFIINTVLLATLY